jgi:hypothetical protein
VACDRCCFLNGTCTCDPAVHVHVCCGRELHDACVAWAPPDVRVLESVCLKQHDKDSCVCMPSSSFCESRHSWHVAFVCAPRRSRCMQRAYVLALPACGCTCIMSAAWGVCEVCERAKGMQSCVCYIVQLSLLQLLSLGDVILGACGMFAFWLGAITTPTTRLKACIGAFVHYYAIYALLSSICCWALGCSSAAP